MDHAATERDADPTDDAALPARPGLLLVFARGRSAATPIATFGDALEIGRSEGSILDDPSVSRRHLRLTPLAHGFGIEDLGSRNGTYVDGVLVRGSITAVAPAVLRLGSAVFLFVPDVGAFDGKQLRRGDGVVAGPGFAATLRRVGHVAKLGSSLHLSGETGAGKEVAAREFHARGPRPGGPFVAVNCAALPAALAERLLFGAKKGAFSGADTDSIGLIQAAHQGTLFLDEITDLDPAVQAKLLRCLESNEVTPLGSVRATPVDVRICTASLRDLEEAVAAGRFRADLYYRVGRPALRVPPLRDRREEIPALVECELERMPVLLSPSATAVETCLLRPWPGNVRQLFHSLRDASSLASAQGHAVVKAEHFEDSAEQRPHSPPKPGTQAHRTWVQAALCGEDGNVSRAARRLGVHRNQLRRWIARYPVPGVTETEPAGGEN